MVFFCVEHGEYDYCKYKDNVGVFFVSYRSEMMCVVYFYDIYVIINHKKIYLINVITIHLRDILVLNN